MKTIIAALVITVVPVNAMAGVLLPNTCASVYCQSKKMVMAEDSAIKQAVYEAFLDHGDGTPVTIGTTETTSEVVASYREAKRKCPQYFS